MNFVIFDWYLSYSFRNCTLPWYRTDNSKMMRNVQSSELCFWIFPRSCWTIDLDQFKMKDNVSKLALWFKKPVSQSCAEAKSNTFWRATGQSNLAYKWMATTKASKVWFSYSHNCTLANGAVFYSVCQV